MDVGELSSRGSGWVAFALILGAGALPLGYRLRVGRRAGPTSQPISMHVGLGIAVAVTAFVHALFGVMALGSSRAIGVSDWAIWAGSIALLVLMAHVGLGLQLRDLKLRNRAELRLKHLATALVITACAVTHVVMLWAAGD